MNRNITSSSRPCWSPDQHVPKSKNPKSSISKSYINLLLQLRLRLASAHFGVAQCKSLSANGSVQVAQPSAQPASPLLTIYHQPFTIILSHPKPKTILRANRHRQFSFRFEFSHEPVKCSFLKNGIIFITGNKIFCCAKIANDIRVSKSHCEYWC